MKKIFIGIDWGGTFMKWGIFNEKGRLLVKERISSHNLTQPSRFFPFLEGLFKKRFKEQNIHFPNLKGVGIGAPGMIEIDSGLIYYLPNIKGWQNIPFKKIFERKFAVPLSIDNDANVAALAELKRGKAKGFKRALLLTLGTGIGSGLILGGNVFHGKASAVEGGHIPMSLDGDVCGCGARGCIETFLGNKYFIKKAKTFFAKGDPNLKHCKNLTPQDLYALASKKNRAALASWGYYGYVLGVFCCGLINLLNLERIILGGGLSKALRFFKPQMQKTIKERAMRPLNTQVKIERSTLGDDLGIIGAYELIRQDLHANR